MSGSTELELGPERSSTWFVLSEPIGFGCRGVWYFGSVLLCEGEAGGGGGGRSGGGEVTERIDWPARSYSTRSHISAASLADGRPYLRLRHRMSLKV